MNINDKSGWLFNADTKNTLDVTLDDLQMMLKLAKAEDLWAENVKSSNQKNLDSIGLSDFPESPFTILQ